MRDLKKSIKEEFDEIEFSIESSNLIKKNIIKKYNKKGKQKNNI